MTRSLPTLRHQCSSTLSFLRSHGRAAVLPLAGFALALAAVIAGLVVMVLRLREGAPLPAVPFRTGATLVSLVAAVFLVALCNWAWVVCWARGTGKHPPLRSVVLRLAGLYVLYKVVAGVPALLLAPMVSDDRAARLQIAAVGWTLFVVSRGIPALLYVARDSMGVFAAVAKSVGVTKTVWPRVLWYVVAGWAALALCAVLLIAAGVAVKMVVPMPLPLTVGLSVLLLAVLMEVAMMVTLSYVMRLAEAIDR